MLKVRLPLKTEIEVVLSDKVLNEELNDGHPNTLNDVISKWDDIKQIAIDHMPDVGTEVEIDEDAIARSSLADLVSGEVSWVSNKGYFLTIHVIRDKYNIYYRAESVPLVFYREDVRTNEWIPLTQFEIRLILNQDDDDPVKKWMLQHAPLTTLITLGAKSE